MSLDEPIDLVAQPLNTKVRLAIRAEMARRGISQDSLRRTLGRSPAWISWRLTGKTPLSLTDVEDIAAALFIPIDVLLGDWESTSRRRRRAS